MSELSFRPARPDDLAALAVLVNSAYRGESSRRGWTTEADLLEGQRADVRTLAEMIDPAAQIILLCHRAGELVGCVWLKKRQDSAHLGLLTVRPDLQAAGIGKQLLAVAEHHVASEWSLPAIEMTVIARRHELITWYERRGYRDTGRREQFPTDATLDIPKVSDLEMIVLCKEL
jgi:ribosomal protein S18 acetylase RimI-like enzyme